MLISRALVAVSTTALIVAACGYLPGSSPSPDIPTPSSSASPAESTSPEPPTSTPSHSPSPILAESPMPSPSSTSAASNVEKADVFWGEMRQWLCGGSTMYDSLADAVAGSSLIVRGHPVEVETVKDGRYAHNVVSLTVTEVLKGQPRWRDPGTLELVAWAGDHGQERLEQNMPAGDQVIFLISWPDLEQMPFAQVPTPFRYWYLVDTWHQSVFRDDDGVIWIPNLGDIRRMLGRDVYPVDLHGRPYDGFVERIRQLVVQGRGSAVQPTIPGREERSAC